MRATAGCLKVSVVQDIVAVDRIAKSFAGVRALNEVSLSLKQGEIRAVCGENGAGKSTLVKLLMGIVQPDSGTIAIDGNIVDVRGPHGFRWNTSLTREDTGDGACEIMWIEAIEIQ